MVADEVAAVAATLQYYASRAVLLWREPEEILAHLDSFLVAADQESVRGCVALQDFGNGLYEVRSLAVHHEYTGRGIGAALVQGSIAKARGQQAREVFALTKKVAFFQRFGFRLEAKERFPQKVWRDCQKCPKREHCDETAVAIWLSAPESDKE